MITIKLPLTEYDACMHLRHWAARRCEGRTPEFTTDDFEQLLAWVRVRVDAYRDGARSLGFVDFEPSVADFAEWVALDVGEPLESNRDLAVELIELAEKGRPS